MPAVVVEVREITEGNGSTEVRDAGIAGAHQRRHTDGRDAGGRRGDVRVWAPGARSVHVALGGIAGYVPSPDDALVEEPGSHHWTGFFPGVADGVGYRFWVVGEGGDAGPKRDPWARELEFGDFTDTDCIVRSPESYPWHDQGFTPPAFNDLIVYQFHVGVFSALDDAGGDPGPAGYRSSLMSLTVWNTSRTSG